MRVNACLHLRVDAHGAEFERRQQVGARNASLALQYIRAARSAERSLGRDQRTAPTGNVGALRPFAYETAE